MSSQTIVTRNRWHGHGRRVVNVGLGIIITYTLASIAHSHYVVGQIEQMGVDVAFADQLRMSVGDLMGLYAYALVIAIGLIIAWPVMAGIRRVTRASRWIVYPLGGLLAMATIMAAIALLPPMTFVAPARHLSGIAGQCIAGFIGGLAFAWLQSRSARASGAAIKGR